MRDQRGRGMDLPIEWAVAGRSLPGEGISGDLHVVALVPEGVLMAVVDGLGHGEDAAAAAGVVAGILRQHAAEALVPLVERCHEAALLTRGVVMTLARVCARAQAVEWLGVGNVEGVLLRADPAARPAREGVPVRGGVVGYALPRLRASTVPLSPGDILILVSDGIRSGFVEDLNPRDAPKRVAEEILARHARDGDDALVLAARYRGDVP
ncbi:MAG: SpoIIE family protein phosphatase [Armatimonadetes bacterium]|nr:SpoIIE family protein phosphatase [Armatimonadota bacterium]